MSLSSRYASFPFLPFSSLLLLVAALVELGRFKCDLDRSSISVWVGVSVSVSWRDENRSSFYLRFTAPRPAPITLNMRHIPVGHEWVHANSYRLIKQTWALSGWIRVWIESSRVRRIKARFSHITETDTYSMHTIWIDKFILSIYPREGHRNSQSKLILDERELMSTCSAGTVKELTTAALPLIQRTGPFIRNSVTNSLFIPQLCWINPIDYVW